MSSFESWLADGVFSLFYRSGRHDSLGGSQCDYLPVKYCFDFAGVGD
jgi:hypothetical protein